MMKTLYTVGRNMYLMGIAELAIYSFVKGDWAMTRPSPLPEAWQSINPTMTYVSGALLLISVLAFLLNRHRPTALLVIANLIFWLATSRHILNLWRDHINGFKTLWLAGGALLILTSLSNYEKHQKKLLWFNIIILFLFFVDCGVAHFNYADFVKELIPTYFPFRLFFTYFAGVCLILGGVGLLIPQTQKLAAILSGIQIASWFALVHIPRAITLKGDEWIGVGESLAVAGICFMLYSHFKNKALLI